jgi:DNA invertase Pin-like site-specific DNA recombinase
MIGEQVSAVAQRDRLKEALRFVRRNDTLVATKPDRLARSTTDLLRIVDDLDGRGVGLIMLSMGGQTIDTRSPTGKLMITMLGAIAEFERGLLLERQREGVAKAKLDGKYKGRKPTARAKAAEVIKLEPKDCSGPRSPGAPGSASRQYIECWPRPRGRPAMDGRRHRFRPYAVLGPD